MSAVHRDENKLRWDLLPLKAVEQVIKVLTYGASKYESYNWYKGMKYSRLIGSVDRHWIEWRLGSKADKESGIHPLGHSICDQLFLLTYELEQRSDLDDRVESR